ncbi:hypothetical protein SAMN05518871_11217 [Psychrobacillus sp. OK028]|uniref:hypothetical protein n=1 Tax=Psychrobacillus sp. OK028 TaxID=1884359 RepID=UPI000891757C|nr:hypothetical protein [Psychrobacillus sp. OK028]SDO20092.1 hypothetical protein SAMN05518871_11217 [Psychrobacillus sp. OK028]
MNHLDDRVRKEILDSTEDTPSTLKDDIWNHIDQELFQTKGRRKKRVKKKSKVIPIVIAAAAGLMILFSSQTETGSAFIKQIKDLFVPEKEIIQSIEGNEEETNVNLQEGKDSEYIIYIDEERYKLVNGKDSDIITTKEPLEERYPKVSMEIKQFKDITPEEMVSTLETELAAEYTKITTETVTEPVNGYKLHGISGSEWDSPVTNVYVVDNLNGGSFVITEKYFLEAAEGHGARFYAMLQEFEIIE